MATGDLRFGTSGLRGPACQLEGPQTARHVAAFVVAMRGRGLAAPGTKVLVARDLRASSPAIARMCAGALAAQSLVPVDCGQAPTPALALAAMRAGVPAVMVTGSHIPEDRNGLKFYRPDGEIDKSDEAAIIAALSEGAAHSDARPVPADIVAPYLRRYLDFFESGALAGMRVGVYQHSSVARDLLVTLLEALGAEAVPLGRAERFVAIDTEALRQSDIEAARRWARESGLDAIVSTDGDADRPLIADGDGAFLPGDLVGAITASALGAGTVVTPVTSNSALDTSGRFAQVVRTRIGSPHVIAGMAQVAGGGGTIVGFEANGGVLLGSDVVRNGRTLASLPTRDAVLPILAVLSAVAGSGVTLASLAASFAFRPSAAGKLGDVDEHAARGFMDRLESGPREAERLLSGFGAVAATDRTDGVRFTLANGDILHYRRSGNAPELRCYVEAADAARGAELLARGLDLARKELAVEAVA